MGYYDTSEAEIPWQIDVDDQDQTQRIADARFMLEQFDTMMFNEERNSDEGKQSAKRSGRCSSHQDYPVKKKPRAFRRHVSRPGIEAPPAIVIDEEAISQLFDQADVASLHVDGGIAWSVKSRKRADTASSILSELSGNAESEGIVATDEASSVSHLWTRFADRERYPPTHASTVSNVWKRKAFDRNIAWHNNPDHVCRGDTCVHEQMKFSIYFRSAETTEDYDEYEDPVYHVHTDSCPSGPYFSASSQKNARLCNSHPTAALVCGPIIAHVCVDSAKVHFCGEYCESVTPHNTTEGRICDITGIKNETVLQTESGFPCHGGFSLITKRSDAPNKRRLTQQKTQFGKFVSILMHRCTLCTALLEQWGPAGTRLAKSATEPKMSWIGDTSAFKSIRRAVETALGDQTTIDKDIATCEMIFQYAKMMAWNVLFSAYRILWDSVDLLKNVSRGSYEAEKYAKMRSKNRCAVLVPEMLRIQRAYALRSTSPTEAMRSHFSEDQKERIADYHAALVTQVFAHLRGTDAWKKVDPKFAGEFALAVMYKSATGGIYAPASNVNAMVREKTSSLTRDESFDMDVRLLRDGVMPGSEEDPRAFNDSGDTTCILPTEPLLDELLPNPSGLARYGFSSHKINEHTYQMMDKVADVKKNTTLGSLRFVVLGTENVISRMPTKTIAELLAEESERHFGPGYPNERE